MCVGLTPYFDVKAYEGYDTHGRDTLCVDSGGQEKEARIVSLCVWEWCAVALG